MKTTEMHVFCLDDESDTDDSETIRHIQFVQRVLEQELRNNHLLITKWNQEESQHHRKVIPNKNNPQAPKEWYEMDFFAEYDTSRQSLMGTMKLMNYMTRGASTDNCHATMPVSTVQLQHIEGLAAYLAVMVQASGQEKDELLKKAAEGGSSLVDSKIVTPRFEKRGWFAWNNEAIISRLNQASDHLGKIAAGRELVAQ